MPRRILRPGKTSLSSRAAATPSMICRTIVEAHHGDIWVEDNANGGSVFCFVLQPAAKEEILKCGQSQTA